MGRVYHLVVQWEAGRINSNNSVQLAGIGIYEPNGAILSSKAVPRNYAGDSNINGSDPAMG